MFKGRHFQDEIIVLCVRRYPRYSLSDRDLEELMAERGLSVGSFYGLSLGIALRSDPEPTNAALCPPSQSVLAGG